MPWCRARTINRGLELVREAGFPSEGLSRWKQPIDSAGGIERVRDGGRGVQVATAAASDPQQSGIGNRMPAGRRPTGAAPTLDRR